MKLKPERFWTRVCMSVRSLLLATISDKCKQLCYLELFTVFYVAHDNNAMQNNYPDKL